MSGALAERAVALKTLYEKDEARLRAKAGDVTAPMGAYESPVFGEGTLTPRLVLIGEAPGGEEARLGRPFVGRAGRQLDELLRLAGIERENAYVTNTVKYRPEAPGARGPRNRTPGMEEIQEALPLLQWELCILRPSLVVTLGSVPLRALLGLGGRAALITIGEAHGNAIKLTMGGREITLFPLYHPASALYNPALLPVLRDDARGLGRFMNGETQAITSAESDREKGITG